MEDKAVRLAVERLPGRYKAQDLQLIREAGLCTDHVFQERDDDGGYSLDG